MRCSNDPEFVTEPFIHIEQVKDSIDIDVKDSEGNTMLHYCVMQRNLYENVIPLLLELNVDTSVKNKDGLMASELAVEIERVESVSSRPQQKIETRFFGLIKKNPGAVFDLIKTGKFRKLQKTPIKEICGALTDNLSTVLHIAATENQYAMLEWLVVCCKKFLGNEWNSFVNSKDQNQNTPLTCTKHIPCLLLLLTHGAESVPDTFGNLTLHRICKSNWSSEPKASKLIDLLSSEINIKNRAGEVTHFFPV